MAESVTTWFSVGSMVLSSTAVSVTDCAVSQLLVVKVRLAGLAVTSSVSAGVTATVTVFAGWVLSLTVKAAVWPSGASR